ncbi:MAG: hypothetical protein KGD66_00840 [Candidatus Lokiarchaeota archaeon]|nr:hypothetical protein [Candidatus Lokiarchaeota archaeon]
MIIWILESDSGIKLLYKSFLKTDADSDIVSGFLTAFNHFSMVEFKQSLESIEMGGWRWIYILEPDYNLLFVAADVKSMKTQILMGRLNVIRNSFLEKYEKVWKKRGKTWDGDLNVFLPFVEEIEDYYNQWGQIENVSQMGDFFDVLGVFQQVLISIRNIIDHRMYSKSQIIILNNIQEEYDKITKLEKYKDNPELKYISLTKESWFNIIDINLIKNRKEIIIDYLKKIIRMVIEVLIKEKGKYTCLKYFSEEKIYAYIYNNMQLLKDLGLDLFFLDLFLII